MNIVIVGGGFSGIKAALELSNKKGFEITLISRGSDFEYHGSLYRSATGHTPLEVVLRLGEIFEKSKNVQVVLDDIVAVSSTSQTIKGATGRQYHFDKLLMCLGNEINYFGIPGMEANAHTLYTIHDTMKLRADMVKLFSSGTRKKVRVIVIGAGPSGTEVAAELQNFANMVALRYKVSPKAVGVDLIEGADRVLPSLDAKLSAKALARLKKLGVNVLLGSRVKGCTRNIVSLESESRAGDIIIWTAGSKCSDLFGKFPSLFELEHGRVRVDQYLCVPKAQNIYVLGDNASTPYSGMAQTAITDAIFVSGNLKREQRSQEPFAYKPSLPIYTVPIGGKWAVMQGPRSLRSGSYAWMMRRRQDLFVYKNFEPIRRAYRIWRRSNHLAAF